MPSSLLLALILAAVAGIALLGFFFRQMIGASIISMAVSGLMLDTSNPAKLWISGAFFALAVALAAFGIRADVVAMKKIRRESRLSSERTTKEKPWKNQGI